MPTPKELVSIRIDRTFGLVPKARQGVSDPHQRRLALVHRGAVALDIHSVARIPRVSVLRGSHVSSCARFSQSGVYPPQQSKALRAQG